jgi:hypothetical protein
MKVKFIGNPQKGILEDEYGQKTDSLVVGRTYNVLGVEIIKGASYYYLATFNESFYPTPYLSEYFEIVSSQLSKYWEISIESEVVKLMFKDWIRVPDFVTVFVRSIEEGSESYKYLEQFEVYKSRIDKENK